jgi:ribosomal protein S18 acetylase RimI-like enzyme
MQRLSKAPAWIAASSHPYLFFSDWQNSELWSERPTGDFVLAVQVKAPILEILAAVTKPELRRSGVGRRAMREAFLFFEKKYAISEVWLEVHEKNSAAIAFYLGQGFVQVGQRKNYYPDSGAALSMTKILNSTKV